MLIEFKIKNFLSFKDETLFSLLQGIGTEQKGNIYQDIDFPLPKKINKRSGVLKSALIFGANGGGKSNLLKSINFVKTQIILSCNALPNQPIYDNNLFGPFLLNSKTENEPSEFDMTFEIEGEVYRYMFSLNQNEFIKEELYKYVKGVRVLEKKLFSRDEKSGITIGDFNDLGVSDRVLKNSLALSKFAKENAPEALKINKFFNNLFVFNEQTQEIDTLNMLKTYGDEFKDFLLQFLSTADNSIKDLAFDVKEMTEIPLDFLKILQSQNVDMTKLVGATKLDFYLQHHKYDQDRKSIVSKVNFGLGRESVGTKKMYDLAGSIFNVIKNGMVLFIDEIDNNLNSNLVWSIIKSVNNQNISKKRPQVIFTSHDTGLLDIKDLMRRDQIWFAIKNGYGESELKSLVNFDSSARKDASIEKQFRQGEYGGLKRVKNSLFKK